MTRSLDAMRLWLQQESADIATIWQDAGANRTRARIELLYALKIEMKLDGYKIEDYQAEVDEIVDAELDKLYGTERHVDEEAKTEDQTMETHATPDL